METSVSKYQHHQGGRPYLIRIILIIGSSTFFFRFRHLLATLRYKRMLALDNVSCSEFKHFNKLLLICASLSTVFKRYISWETAGYMCPPTRWKPRFMKATIPTAVFKFHEHSKPLESNDN